MRHNQNNNGRRFRGRSNNAGGNGGGGGNTHQTHSHHGNNGGGNRRVNPRMQTFDSNGPDVRIRGTAYQITEKYVALARDATSSGDRVLAESYLQHGEHYQRMINEMTEEYNKYNPPYQQQPQQPQQGDEQPADISVEQPNVALNDLDQGFLVGNRTSHSGNHSASGADGNGNRPERQPRPDGNRQDGNQRRQHNHGNGQNQQQDASASQPQAQTGDEDGGAQVQRTNRVTQSEPA